MRKALRSKGWRLPDKSELASEQARSPILTEIAFLERVLQLCEDRTQGP